MMFIGHFHLLASVLYCHLPAAHVIFTMWKTFALEKNTLVLFFLKHLDCNTNHCTRLCKTNGITALEQHFALFVSSGATLNALREVQEFK